MKNLILLFTYLTISLGLTAQDYTQLYLVGAATPAGWDAKLAVPMAPVEGSEGLFTWTGFLNGGEFKFINYLDNWNFSFTSANDGYAEIGKSYELLYDDASDRKFLVSTPGIFRLTVDIKNLIMDFESAAPEVGLLFNGTSNSYIDIGAATEITQFTVESWVFYNNIPSGVGAYIISTEDAAEGSTQGFSLRADGNKFQLCIGNGNWINVTSNTSIELGTWYHVAATCSDTEIKIYVNGKLEGTAELDHPMEASAKNIIIGDSPTWPGRLLNGVMADLRFYSIVCSEDSIYSDAISGYSQPEAGLIANWKMDEGEASLVNDVMNNYTINKPNGVEWFSGIPVVKPITLSTFNCNNNDIEEAYNLAIKIVGGNVRGGVLAAGAEYNAGWTRDCAINNWFGVNLINPEVAKASMWNVTNDKNTIGAEYWDRIIWVIAALDYYKVNGDMEFLNQAYTCSANSMKIQEDNFFDSQYGLFKGPSVFNDGIAGYPEPVYDPSINSGAVVSHPNSEHIKCLSTNCIYYGAYLSLAEMGAILNIDDAVLQDYRNKANSIKSNILKYLYDQNEDKLHYLIDNLGNVAKYQEGLGISFATILGVLDTVQAKKVIEGVTISKFGITSVYPDFERFSPEKPGRHNNIIWPHVNAFFAQAAIKVGDTSAFKNELDGITKLALDRDKGNYDFCEVYNPYSGIPDGGWQSGSHWGKVTRQTWCATGYMNMVYNGLFGMRFTPNGITFSPFLPADINFVELKDILYRESVLNIVVKGNGTKIKSFKLNGVVQHEYKIKSTISGENKIEIELEPDISSGFSEINTRPNVNVWPGIIKSGENLNIDTIEEGTIRIISVQGSVLIEKTMMNNIQLAINLPAGIYYLQFVNGYKNDVTKAFIVK